MHNQRIKSIRDAATILFLQEGYKKTQISHIAKAIGVSVGTIYHDFAGKREIMHFVLKCTITPEFIEQEFERPITDDLFTGLEDEIIATLEATWEELSANLSHIEEYSFEALISDAYDLLSRYAVGCLFIEKNQSDVKRLTEYYKSYRKRFFEIMIQYVNSFIEHGIIRPLEHVELSTSLMIEILTWWAMDRRYISFEKTEIPDTLAKEVCLDNIITAYKK